MVEKEREVAGVKKDLENKGLVVVLVVLAVVIVGLIVAVVINTIKVDKVIVSDCNNDGLNDFEMCVQKVYKEGASMDSVVENYQHAIEEAKGVGDYDYAAELIQSRTSFLAVRDGCDEMVELMDSEDLNGFDNKNVMVIYSQMEGASITCGDEQTVSKYREKLKVLMEKVGGH